MRKTDLVWDEGGLWGKGEHSGGGNSKCKGWEVGRGLASLKVEPQVGRELKEEGEVSERLKSQSGSDPAGFPGRQHEFRFYLKYNGKPLKRFK